MSDESNITMLTKILLQEVANRPDLIKGITDAGGVDKFLKSIPVPEPTMKERREKVRRVYSMMHLKDKQKKGQSPR